MKKLMMVLSLVLALGLSGCKEKEEETLVVLTSSGYAPYEMVDTDGSLIGFDIELMEALAAEAGITIEWKDVDFSGIVASLQSGQYEVAIAGMSPSPSRDEVIDFSNTYYNSEAGLENYLLFETEDGITGVEDLSGLVVGAQLGTIQADLLNEIADTYGFTVELRNTNVQIVEEIKIGAIDVLVVESAASTAIIDENTGFSKVLLDVNTDAVSGTAIAFSEGSPYVEIFNEALATLEENGTLAVLIEKWFE